ncbi:MAG: hypothetical protein ACXVCP_20215 [Bdellovibrio sp.]
MEMIRDEDFYPHGAIAFFGLLIFILATIWFIVYFIMAQQA